MAAEPTQQQLQTVIAANIASLRRANGLTQAGLAEKLGYSDKSVSKWERAEGLPDVLCLKAMADLFGVSVDYLLEADHPDTPDPTPDSGSEEGEENVSPVYRLNRRNVAGVSVAGVWFLAAAAFVITVLAGKPDILPFALAAPVSAVLLVVFAALWGGRLRLFFAVTLLVWGLMFLLCWIFRASDPWLAMILGIPATVVVGLACRVTTKETPKE